jgi:hypothetical protein
LVAICDQLDAHLTRAQEQSRRFLEAVLHETLASAEPAPEHEVTYA